ncbi:MAG: hypothetical protein HRU09_18715, partial [Oligoflexales bacterium]|nr:hypothetical protein [Oligoflexales bacterium]
KFNKLRLEFTVFISIFHDLKCRTQVTGELNANPNEPEAEEQEENKQGQNQEEEGKQDEGEEGEEDDAPEEGDEGEQTTDPEESNNIELELTSGRMLLGGNDDIFAEENVGCADGELRTDKHEEDLDLELKVKKASEFSISLEDVCGLDYEGARLHVTDKDGTVLYDYDLEPGLKEYRFPPEGFSVTLEEGIYDLKVVLGRKDIRGPLGIFVWGQDIDSVSVGAIKISLTEDVVVFGDFTTE